MQASQLTPSHPSMSDLIRLPLLYNLTVHIEMVLKSYLHSRFGLIQDDFDISRSLEEIIEILDNDPNIFINKRLSESSASVNEGSTYQYVVRALVNSAVALKQLTGKDGRSRLDSLRWLCLCLRHFQNYQAEFLKVKDLNEGERFRDLLSADIKIFFAEINIWLKTTPSSEYKPGLLCENKSFVIVGLKDDPTKLAELLNTNLLLVFKPETIVFSVSQDVAVHCARLTNVKNFRDQEKRKQDEVLALKNKLEESGNAVRDLQSALYAIEQQSLSYVHELRIKKMQESTYERRIEKLIQEKTSLEVKRQSSHQVDDDHFELKAKQQELDEALLEQKLFQEEAAQLHVDAANAKERHSVLQQELSKFSGYSEEGTAQLDQSNDMPFVADAESEEPGDDAFDVEKFTQHLTLTKKLEKHKQAASAKCLSLAQHFVLTKRADYLRAILQNPALDDKQADKGAAFSGKSLVELIMFELPRLTLPSTRNNLLRTVFEFSPAVPRNPIQDLVYSRYLNEGCSTNVVDTYCQYVIAYNTCSVGARQDFLSLLQKIKVFSENLKSTPFAKLLNELDIPLTVCHTLEKCYLKGAFSSLKALIDDEPPLANASQYEVVYDFNQKAEANNQYKKSHGDFPIRVRLLNRLNLVNEALKTEFEDVVRTVKPVAKASEAIGFEMSVKLMESLRDLNEKKAVAPSPQKMSWIPKDKVIEKDLLEARELVYQVIALIDRYGVVLSMGAFNDYQCREITKRIEEEQPVLEDQVAHLEVNKQQLRK